MNTATNIKKGTRFTYYNDLSMVVYEVTESKVRYYNAKFIGQAEAKNTFGHWMGVKKFNAYVSKGEIKITEY